VQEVDADLRGEMERRLSSVDESVAARLKESARADAASREELLKELAALRKDLTKMREELQTAMKRSLASLDAEKVDRFTLARILADASVRLQGEAASGSGESRKDD